MSDDLAVVTEGLRRTFGGRAALDGVSVEVRRGSLFGLLGPNGGGKTTLFQVLATLLPPTSGRASVLGCDVAAEPDRVRASIGVVFQAPSLDRFLPVRANLLHQGHLYGLSGGRLRARIETCLHLVSLLDRADEEVSRLSGGMKRRVELAKGLLHEPELLLLDEPTAGVDPQSRNHLFEALAGLLAAGRTLIYTTHYMEEAERLCDRVLILDRGRAADCGTRAELAARAGVPGADLERVFLELTGRSLRDEAA